jgi:hypothetical protein
MGGAVRLMESNAIISQTRALWARHAAQCPTVEPIGEDKIRITHASWRTKRSSRRAPTRMSSCSPSGSPPDRITPVSGATCRCSGHPKGESQTDLRKCSTGRTHAAHQIAYPEMDRIFVFELAGSHRPCARVAPVTIDAGHETRAVVTVRTQCHLIAV